MLQTLDVNVNKLFKFLIMNAYIQYFYGIKFFEKINRGLFSHWIDEAWWNVNLIASYLIKNNFKVT